MKLNFRLPSFFASLAFLAAGTVGAIQVDVPGPPGSVSFGASVTALPNGNIVVTDPDFDAPGPIAGAGAIYLYSGGGQLLTTLLGGKAGDHVGSGKVVVLSNGNCLVSSPQWHNGPTADAGAVTWINATTGLNGVVSGANSLVGGRPGDSLDASVVLLSNGNFLLYNPHLDYGAGSEVGAVTWGDASVGLRGLISTGTSLIGAKSGDQIGSGGITILTNGNYVVASPKWDGEPFADVGAVTWGSGAGGVRGLVSDTNSLVGSQQGDNVGLKVTALTNGNYVVSSPNWRSGTQAKAGAATWGSGTAGVTGQVSSSNSLVGTTADDGVGTGVKALTNGNYVVVSPQWQNSLIAHAGAVTWGSGTTGISGFVSSTNSLVGAKTNDQVGNNGVAALSGGNYVVSSYLWDNGGTVDAGAATWGSGTQGIKGEVSTANSLVGTHANDRVSFPGITVISLSTLSSNYVVCSTRWTNGTQTQAGAVTWCSSNAATAAPVSPANSLVGSTAFDQIGSGGITALRLGGYVVSSPLWDNGAAVDAGAATWGSFSKPLTGVVSSANSLVGSTAGDKVSSGGVTALANGNYVVSSPLWDNGAIVDAGAVTWGSGSSGIKGTVADSNPMVGSTAGDKIGETNDDGTGNTNGITALSSGNFVVASPHWTNPNAPSTSDAGDGSASAVVNGVGALTFASGNGGNQGILQSSSSLVGTADGDAVGSVRPVATSSSGLAIATSPQWGTPDRGAVTLGGYNPPFISGVVPISAANSVLGASTAPGASARIVSSYNALWRQMVVGQPAANLINLFSLQTDIQLQAYGGANVPSYATQDFGSIAAGKSLSQLFVARNTSLNALFGTTFTKEGPDAADFIVTKELAFGSFSTYFLTIKFAPKKPGIKRATLHMEANSGGLSSPFNLLLTGTALTPILPVAKTLPADTLTYTTATLRGQVDAKGQTRAITFEYGPTTAYGYQLNAVPATLNTTGLTDVSADISSLKPHTRYFFRVKAAGTYGDALGATRSFITADHVPTAFDDSYTVKAKSKTTLNVLSDDSDLDGDNLTITSYTTLSLRTAGTLAKIANKMVFTASASFAGGVTFSYTVSDGFGKTATATVTLDLDPTPKPANVNAPPTTVTVSDAKVLPPGAIGIWHGLVAREETLNHNLGARLQLTATARGLCTGKIAYGASSFGFRGQFIQDPADPQHPSLSISISRREAMPLQLELNLDAAIGTLSGTVSEDDGTHTATVDAWRYCTANAIGLPHSSACILKQANQNPSPGQAQGDGAGTLLLNPASGVLTVAGKLADGAPFLSSTFPGPQGQLLIYQPLYASQGSLAGILILSPGNAITVAADHVLDWLQPAFGPIGLTVIGSP